jgi:hypothetical protein
MTVQLSEYFLFEKGETESLPKVILHDNCEKKNLASSQKKK